MFEVASEVGNKWDIKVWDSTSQMTKSSPEKQSDICQQLLEDQQNEDQGPWLLGVAMLRTHVIDEDSFLSRG